MLKRDLLPRLLPLLGACKGDARIPLGRALHSFAEAIAAHEGAGAAAGERAGGGAQAFASEMHAAIELLLAGWLASRSDKVREAACEAMSSMVVLLPPNTLRALVPRLVPGLLAAQRREYEWERFPITSALWATLVHCESCALGREMHSEQLILPLVTTLLGAVCAPLDRSSASCLKNHNEELRCLEACAALAMEPVLGYLLAQLEAGDKEPPAICGILEVLRHLVTRERLAAWVDSRHLSIVSAIVGLLPSAHSHRVRLSIVQLVVGIRCTAMAAGRCSSSCSSRPRCPPRTRTAMVPRAAAAAAARRWGRMPRPVYSRRGPKPGAAARAAARRLARARPRRRARRRSSCSPQRSLASALCYGISSSPLFSQTSTRTPRPSCVRCFSRLAITTPPTSRTCLRCL